MQKAKLTPRESIVVILDETGLNKTLEHHTMKTAHSASMKCVIKRVFLRTSDLLDFQIYTRPVCIFISQSIPDTKNDENYNKKFSSARR